jgi:hypothetical protein
MAAVWEELRPQMQNVLASRIERSHGCDRSPTHRYAKQTAAVKTVEKDYPIAIPTAKGPQSVRRIAECSGRPAM